VSNVERPSWRQTTRWTATFALTSVVMSAPYLPLDRVGATPAWGDARIIASTLAWHACWPATGDAPLDAPLFRPEPRGLVHSEPLLGLAWRRRR
jgi:hypothetical protein